MTGRRPREDLYDTFPPENRTDHQPALLNSAEVLAAARVAGRLLHVLARRGGTRVEAAALEELLETLDEALPEGATPQCDDEAARILDWLETAEQIPPDERDHQSLPPELDLMLGSDIENRVSVARFAMDQEHDLDLEYFDEETNTWPRFRCRPLEIRESDEQELDPTLVVERRGNELELPVRTIRWLMPVQRRPVDDDARPVREQLGDVLDFPSDRLTDRPDEADSNSGDSTGESTDRDGDAENGATGGEDGATGGEDGVTGGGDGETGDDRE